MKLTWQERLRLAWLCLCDVPYRLRVRVWRLLPHSPAWYLGPGAGRRCCARCNVWENEGENEGEEGTPQ